MSDSHQASALSFPPTLLEGWRDAFVNRDRPYAVQQADGSYRWVYEECTLSLLAAHLAGEVTLALSSTTERGWTRWACLDVDASGSLPQLVALRDALAELTELTEPAALPGLVVGSRRGGHLWLLLDELVPSRALRYVIRQELDVVAARGVEVPAHELYPDRDGARTLGHAVRLPLGVHHKTGRRYPPYDDEGLPCVFTAPERAAAYILDAAPRIPAARILAPWDAFLAAGGRHGRRDRECAAAGIGPGARKAADTAPSEPLQGPARGGERVGTRSGVIRWVDARISPRDLLTELAPDTELKRVGRGYRGWCPFHDDRAADTAGLPGTPSFYVVHDRRYGWSWRCLSTNCAFSTGPMKHTFRLWQELLGLSAAAAMVEAVQRWPAADGNGVLVDGREWTSADDRRNGDDAFNDGG